MWQLLTLVTLLVMMIALERFQPSAAQVYLGQIPFSAKSLAATGFIVLAAFTTGALFRRFKIPALLGYIAAGIVFGPELIQIVFEFMRDNYAELTTTVFGPESAKPGYAPKALFSRTVIKDLALINILTVGVIGTMGGGELKLADIKDTWRTILLIIVFIVFTAIPLSVGAVMAVDYLPGNLTAFLDGVSTSSKIGAALLFGILAVAMSPAATLAIIQESKAKGKFTSLVLGIVVVADLTLVALFLVGFNIAKLMVGPSGFQMEGLLAAMPGIALEFGWALVIGSVTGVIIILYMRYVKREMMLFTVAVIFAASYISTIVHAETLLAFLTAGFIVQNFSRHGHDLIHELERISMPVFIIYFMTQAALLDLKGVVAFLPLTLILAGVRALAFWVSVKGGLKIIPAEEKTNRWLWISFFSRGGVDLVLAAMVAGATNAAGQPIFSWGQDFQTVVMATVVVHIVAGPPLLKMAFSGSGETEDARQESQEGTGQAGTALVLDLADQEVGEFPSSSVKSPFLAERLDEMREGLIDLHERFVITPLENQRQILERSIEQVNEELHQSLIKLREVVESEMFDDMGSRIRAIENLHLQSRRRIRPYIVEWEGLDEMVFAHKDAQGLMLAIEKLEDFNNQFVVEMEPELYDKSQANGGWSKLVRSGRRIEKFLAGSPGRRMVPTGRLWRYYVQLSVPMYLAQAAGNTALEHEVLWFELGCYLRRFDTIFEQAIAQLVIPATSRVTEQEEPLAEDSSPSLANVSGEMPILVEDSVISQSFAMMQSIQEENGHHDDDHGHEEPEPVQEDPDPYSLKQLVHELDPTEEPRPRTIHFIQRATEQHQANATSVIDQASTWLQTASKNYSWSLQQAYRAMLDAVAKAGTLELPAFRYRTSRQFDNARRAEARLEERLQREANVVSGYSGWIVLDHQLFLFQHWFIQYEQRISDTLRNLFEQQCLHYLERLEQKCAQGVKLFEAQEEAIEPEWDTWLRREITPMIRSTRRALDRALVSFGQGVASRRLIDALEYRVAGFPETLCLLLEDPHVINPREKTPEVLTVKIRQWLGNRMVSELALRFIEFNERVERLARRNLVGLENIEQVLEYNLFTVQKEIEQNPEGRLDSVTDEKAEPTDDSDHVALSALKRAARFIEQMQENMRTDLEEVEQWILDETKDLRERAVDPFLTHQLQDIQRKLRRQDVDTEEERKGRIQRLASPFKAVSKRAYSAVFPFYSELWDDLQHILSDEVRAERRARVRQQLEVDLRHSLEVLPPIYKRLFNPVPLDLPEFYVERPELEERILKSIARWGDGERMSLLLFGDRGIGKRTFLHNLVPIKVYDLGPVFQQTPIHTVRIGEEVETEAQLCAQFALLFPGMQINTLDELERALASTEERTVLMVENGNKLFMRTEAGFSLCKKFLKVIGSTSQQILWLVTLDTPAATLLDTMIDLFDYFNDIFEVEPLSHEAIESMILNRHRVSGFEVEYEAPTHRPIERLRHPFASNDAQRHPKRDFFRRLGDMSHGNPLLALLYWLRAITPNPDDDTKLSASLPYPSPEDLTNSLTLQKQLILALLIQHGSLTVQQLAMMLTSDVSEVQTELNQLSRLRFVKTISGAAQSYQLQDFAVVEVTRELRQHNLV